MIGIFNRSHYESVLVERVKELVPKKVWSERYDHINNFEQMLADEGVTILKFFLHISKDEQKRRLEKRLERPAQELEVQPRRPRGAQALGRLPGGVRRHAGAVLDRVRRRGTSCPSDRKWFRNWVLRRDDRAHDGVARHEVPDPVPGLDKIVIE